MYEAKVIADSICDGNRLTTMQVTHPIIVHAEFMTHCAYARCASSSRAIPFAKMVKRVEDDPFVPRRVMYEQTGMQGYKLLSEEEYENFVSEWNHARDNAIRAAKSLSVNGIHKSIANRLIGPWSWITVCVTGDEAGFANYFALRCHEAADYNIQDQAWPMQYAYFTSTPTVLRPGEWHLPYVTEEDREEVKSRAEDSFLLVKISAGRCARTSYLTQECKRSLQADIDLHDKLVSSKPMHASPLEHVACALPPYSPKTGKFIGWRSYRHELPNESTKVFTPNHPLLKGLTTEQMRQQPARHINELWVGEQYSFTNASR
jgi:thymidylate synthase ThyX